MLTTFFIEVLLNYRKGKFRKVPGSFVIQDKRYEDTDDPDPQHKILDPVPYVESPIKPTGAKILPDFNTGHLPYLIPSTLLLHCAESWRWCRSKLSCRLPLKVGDCRGSFQRYFYNIQLNKVRHREARTGLMGYSLFMLLVEVENLVARLSFSVIPDL